MSEVKPGSQRAHALLLGFASLNPAYVLLESDDESGVEPVFHELAEWTAECLAASRLPGDDL